jgi:Eco29kI restriction endonuclease
VILSFDVPENLESNLLIFYRGQDVYALDDLESMRGELNKLLGCYILFYKGEFELYKSISEANKTSFERPIYIGKAVPKGDRTGLTASRAVLENSLYKRLKEHYNSISVVNGIETKDFFFKVVPTTFHLASWVESVLISTFVPAWNRHIDGFGNHDPGKGRYQQKRSVWDLIHSGRSWAFRMENLAKYSEDEIAGKISDQYYKQEVKLEHEIETVSEDDSKINNRSQKI